HYSRAPPALHSFPTRRSSDLHSFDVDAHAAGAARNGAHRGVEAGCGEVGLLELRDLFQLLARDLANLRRIGRSRAFFNTDRLAEDRKSTRLNSSHVAISYAVF